MKGKKSGRISNTLEDKEIFKQIAINIEKEKIKKALKNKEIAEKLEITPQAVSSIIRRLKNGEGIEIPTLRKWASALGIEISIFFEK